MRREVTIEEISDGRLYGSNDMVKADCYDCAGCCDCCKGMGDSVLLDPYDVHRMSAGLGKSVEQLLETDIELGMADGNILPHLRMDRGSEERCVFLSEEGRCTIHAHRPGICRLFPLGRVYENGGFQYFLQVHECSKKNRGKIKVHKWLDTPQFKTYERFVSDWHYFLLDMQKVLQRHGQDGELVKNLNLYVVKRFYLKSYEADRDFYEQFYERLAEAKSMIA